MSGYLITAKGLRAVGLEESRESVPVFSPDGTQIGEIAAPVRPITDHYREVIEEALAEDELRENAARLLSAWNDSAEHPEYIWNANGEL